MERRLDIEVEQEVAQEVARLHLLSNEEFFDDQNSPLVLPDEEFRVKVLKAVDWSFVPPGDCLPRAFHLPGQLRVVSTSRGLLDPTRLPLGISLSDADEQGKVEVHGSLTLERLIDEYLFAVSPEKRGSYFPLLFRLQEWRVTEEKLPLLPQIEVLRQALYRELEMYGIRAKSRADLRGVMSGALAPFGSFLPVCPPLPGFVDALWPPSLI